MLLVENDNQGKLKFYCQTCPYFFGINNKVVSKVPLVRKQIDSDVFGGDEAWNNSQQVDIECPTCKVRRRAHLMEIQVYPADEPKTAYYKCTYCATRWRN
ncbi:RNA polymerase III subunit [Cavenderia fasciculata]|uniref:RNA polymerase III subunit n=1 Tax=Cavenderia fasciculata TaxID=261658 RepID=F4PRB1_CACFS|nr:RNA polymerase III subunit [Cavenderia fasciculata]EGG21311.1 RNA polymerase III subunit [Cavenderia fasciculata]|eukprot:XP_004359161.1 RNA polymerase III subunit [Cavenderia fasciculata]